MRLAAFVSGGKDSIYSLYLAKNQGHDIKYIVTFLSENPESYMFHVPNVHLVEEQARLMNVPVVKQVTKGEKENELEDITQTIKKIRNEIDGIVMGAVASTYQKSRIDKICTELSLHSVAPLWGLDPALTVEGMIDDGFEIIIQAVGAPPLDEQWLGRRLDRQCLKELIKLNKSHSIHINGEGGEYESLVLYCPLFFGRIVLDKFTKHWDAKTKSGRIEIEKYHTEQQ